ncbi:hypothetical protein BKA83DRAFT_4120792 [Pisolithus microcarpus]|nr:hypothetical protein BKA83DRAFT_4120792 [Pisolithus microcarpus]
MTHGLVNSGVPVVLHWKITQGSCGTEQFNVVHTTNQVPIKPSNCALTRVVIEAIMTFLRGLVLFAPKSKCCAWQREQLGLSLHSSPLTVNSTPSSSPSLDDFHNLPAYDNFDVIQPDHDAIDTFVPFSDSDFDGEERIWNPSIAESAALLAELGQGHQIQPFSGAGVVFNTSKTFLKCFEMDPFSSFRCTNLYYPFASLNDWEMANFLLQSKMSMVKIDKFLSLSSSPAILYFRDSLECIEALFNHPYYADHMMYTPFRVFTSAERVIREFSEWMSGDMAWQMQSKLPPGATLCSVILSSDKTHIMNMCGGKVAHPLLISLANIKMAVQNKVSLHAFLLNALMPIVEFIHPMHQMHSVLEARLFHECLDIVLQPLKVAAQIGRMMSDPTGNLHHCFTPLAAYIVDTPEACMLACICGKTSPVTMASHKDFGDAFRHECHTGARTLSQLSRIQCDPNDLERYFAQCKEFRLSGVVEPFWQNWPLTNPANFLTPEPLHHWYWKFWDHDVQWCKNALGAPELDFRYSVLHPIVGMHHFKDAIIGGAASREVVIVVHALMDFWYLAQAPRITSIIQDRIKATLVEFHNHKDKITDEGLQRGAESGSALDHWFIPKLELMQSVTPNISELGAPVQWSADMTEHAHIEVIKEPASTTNHQNYNTQICRYLDRVERCWLFKTATCLSTLSNANDTHDQDLAAEDDGAEDGDMNMADDEDAAAILKDIWSSRRSVLDLFSIAERLRTTSPSSIPQPTSEEPLQTIWVMKDHMCGTSTPLANSGTHLQMLTSHSVTFRFGTSSLEPMFTINAHLPDHTWKYGHHDAVILQVDVHHEWPASGLTGHTAVDVHLIMCPISPRGLQLVWDDHLLVCVQRFDMVPQQQADVDLATRLHVLKRATHALGEFLGDIFPLDQIKSYAHLVPCFGEAADNRFMSTHSFHSAQSFWLNSYFDKEFYYALSL